MFTYRNAMIVLVTLAAIVGAKLWFDGVKTDAYRAGVKATEIQFQAQVAEQNRRNREVEAEAQRRIDDANEALKVALVALAERGDSATETVTKIIERHPELDRCEIPAEAIAARNKLRVGK